MSQNRRNLYIHTQVVWLSLFCAVGFNAYAVDDAVLQKFYAEIKSATEEYDKTVDDLRSNQVEPGVGTYKTTGKRRTKGYDEEEETPVGAMFEINGFCFVDGKDFDLKEKETCDKLTRRGTWWISSSFGNIEGDARCGQPSEQEDLVLADMGQIPCFCKITSIDGKSIADAKWVHTASYDPKGKFDSQSDFFCESNCAGYCHDSLFKHKRLGNAYGYLREYLAELKSGNIHTESKKSNTQIISSDVK